MTRSGLEPTIYRTRGEHVNDYTTDAVQNLQRRQVISMASVNNNNKKKWSLNSDGQQCQKYPKTNEQSPLSPQIIEHKKDHHICR